MANRAASPGEGFGCLTSGAIGGNLCLGGLARAQAQVNIDTQPRRNDSTLPKGNCATVNEKSVAAARAAYSKASNISMLAALRAMVEAAASGDKRVAQGARRMLRGSLGAVTDLAADMRYAVEERRYFTDVATRISAGEFAPKTTEEAESDARKAAWAAAEPERMAALKAAKVARGGENRKGGRSARGAAGHAG